jgi:hypothetical protein
MCRIGKYIPDVSGEERRALSGAADEQPRKERRAMDNRHRHRHHCHPHRCAAIENDGNDDFDNDDIGKAEAVAKTTMTTTSDAHVGGGTIDTTIKK